MMTVAEKILQTWQYGKTCPVLNIAKAFAQDYGSCLMYFDWYMNHQSPSDPSFDFSQPNESACRALTHWAEIWHAIKSGEVPAFG